jgi:hypothetical protein
LSIRAGHGAGAGRPHVEVLPADELPAGLPAPAWLPQAGERVEHGRFAKGATSAQAAGGRARAGSVRLARTLGLTNPPDSSTFAPYRRQAAAFRRAHVAQLARTVGGGYCGPAPSSIVATAAWQLALSRYILDNAENCTSADLVIASRMGNESRQNLLAAHELCAKEAQKRPKQNATQNALAAITASGGPA